MVKIEAGKYYRTREGEKVGPMHRNNGIVDVYPFATYNAEGIRIESYTPHGYVNSCDEPCSGDLISEWADLAADEPEFTVDWPHGHVTRNGRKARVICTDRVNPLPIVALVTCADNTEAFLCAYENGRCGTTTDTVGDLLNAPAPKREWWVNVYPDGSTNSHATAEAANYCRGADRIACVHVTEGDGL